MKAVFALAGAIIGLNLGFRTDILSIVLSSVISLILLSITIRKKMVLYGAVPLAFGAALSFAYNYIPISYDGVDSFSGIIVRDSSSYFVLLTLRGKFYVSAKDHSYELFDLVRVNGFAKPYFHANYESQFDFGEYLRLKGVTYEISSKSIEMILGNPIRMKSYGASMTGFLDENARPLFRSLLFNQKDYSSAILSGANAVGASYIVSSSGIFYMGILGFFHRQFKFRLNDKPADLAEIAVGTLILPFGITKVGILRAYLCLWARFINKHILKDRFEPHEVLSAVGIGMLAISPFFASDSGFLLGFGVSFTLYYAKPILARFGKIEKKILALFLIRLIVFPISVSDSGYRPLSFYYGLILTPFSWIAVILGYPCVIFHFGGGMLNGYASFYKMMVEAFAKNSPSLPLPIIGTGFYFVYYIVFLLCLFFVEIGARPLKNGLIIGCIGVYATSLIPVQYLFTSQVSFINVGQGDSILIRDRSTVVMIDTGGIMNMDMATETLIPFLRKQRIYHVDCLIASHGDYDHIGAKDSLMANFKVNRFVEDASEFPLKIGGLTFENYNVYQGSDENENSLVLRTEVLGKSWLFTGDAGKEVEQKIVRDFPDLDVDMLKVGHHGSSTSSTEEFLKLITPEMAIISCGRANKYKHPNDEVLARLEKLKIPYRRTDLEGTITYFG